jgi:uncharacterized membrane protein
MTNNKAREINSPVIKQLLDETTAEELAKIDTEMTNNKQQTALTSLIILIGVVILIWAMAKIDAVFIGVLITTLLVFMYGCIQLTIIRNKGGINE